MGVRLRSSPSIAVSVYYLPNAAALLLPRMVLVKPEEWISVNENTTPHRVADHVY